MKKTIAVALFLAGTPWLVADDMRDRAPTHANVPYGPHEANVLDLWIAEGDGPRPLHVYIHGGGWTGGDKFRKGNPQKTWLTKGVSYAAINYRHTPESPLPAPVHDAARAIQFLRSKAAEWNIDKNRICLSGTPGTAFTIPSTASK